MKNLILSVLLCTIACSCLKQEESIDPFVAPKSLSEIQRKLFSSVASDAFGENMNKHRPKYSLDESKPDVFFLKVEYNFSNIDINAAAGGEGNFEFLANKFVVFFAKAFFKMGGDYQVELDEIELEIPALDIDRDLVSAIYLDGARIQYSNRSRHYLGKDANFKFIKNFEITAPFQIPGSPSPLDLLLFGYTDTKNQCDYQCVEFDIYTYNILDLIGESTILTLKPDLTVQSLPAEKMEFSGSIDIVIELKMPF